MQFDVVNVENLVVHISIRATHNHFASRMGPNFRQPHELTFFLVFVVRLFSVAISSSQEEITLKLKNQLREEMRDELKAELHDEVAAKIRDEISATVRRDLAREIGDELRGELTAEIRSQVYAGVT